MHGFTLFEHSLNMVSLVSHAGLFMTSSYIFIYFISFNVQPFDNRTAEPQKILLLLSDDIGTEDPITALTSHSNLCCFAQTYFLLTQRMLWVWVNL